MDLEKIDEENFKFKNSIVVIGFFDGVHLGHKKIINDCADRARAVNCSSMVLTFNRPPVNVVRNDTFKKLIIPFEEKIKFLMEQINIKLFNPLHHQKLLYFLLVLVLFQPYF